MRYILLGSPFVVCAAGKVLGAKPARLQGIHGQVEMGVRLQELYGETDGEAEGQPRRPLVHTINLGVYVPSIEAGAPVSGTRQSD